MSQFAYAGKILSLDLSSGAISESPTSDYAGRFLGGRGLAAAIYWDEVPPQSNAFDPENRLIFATGPLAGVPVIGGSRWQACAKSPAATPHHFSYANLGGRWGAALKFAGYDALVIHGRADRPVYLLIHDGSAQMRDASSLWGKGAIETRQSLKQELGSSARVVAVGPAGESLAVMATLLADNDASGSAGLGAVMGSKKLKAIVVSASGRGVHVARPDDLHHLITYYRGLKRVSLNTSSYRYSTTAVPGLSHKMKQRDPCYGCLGCFRKLYRSDDGQTGKYMCHSAMFYQARAMSYYGGWNEVPFHATRLVDSYGLDSKAVDLIIDWLQRCHQAGLLDDAATGLPLSRIGSLEFLEALLNSISSRRGIGDLLAQGLARAADFIGPAARDLTRQLGYISLPQYRDIYGPRLYTTHALLYATEPRLPIQQLHEVGALIPKWVRWATGQTGAVVSSAVVRAIARRFWGGELAADFSTYEGKALAARMIQDRQTAKECLILCDYLWPITDLESSPDHVGDPTLESRLLSAVTGRDTDEEELYKIGARVFNLQRAILAREGRRGREDDDLPGHCFTEPLQYDHLNPDCLVPGRDGEVISREGAVIDRAGFEGMKEEYYRLRGWDAATGLQTRASLEELDLGDVARDLEGRGLLAGPAT
jgi:aldehyde:ferredoxin oxidoreductase